MVTQVKDVMGVVAIAVHRQATCTELMATMRRFKVNAVAVIDTDGRPVGMVSEDDLLSKETGTSYGEPLFEGRRRRQEPEATAGLTAQEIMTSPALTVSAETPIREAARLMRDHRIKQLPVIDPTSGKITGTVHQVDLLKVFSRWAPDILADVAAAIARLHLDTRTLAITVDDGVVRVGGRLARRSQIAQLTEAGRRIKGVVDLQVDATYGHDDQTETPSLRV
ncbi:CBS domain-containing protein [Streptosporangium roseum]|uniref:Signal-transduction protein containing cAMP-binding and CBS domains-like protein n=1 Tax=Streptosporangium roseum (strain ATCC 12428 / DSM 43021 / JCM 3005 / KCTC 9067 / NCIMB 10171 / NRRL 2505 / NI 9100) TaxID=479432 RepID=D2B6S1_STRRD|nr:CBS domain-containing protein [Streptosporangium roseum]ACZ87659.1 signal-transduction protein containing cAMP- binding and CBS domains-like protein [Streptosporangium roseum DSM 43021]